MWRPEPGTTWQWQITGTVDERSARDVRRRPVRRPPAASNQNAGMVERLQRRGIVVICYLAPAPGRVPARRRLFPAERDRQLDRLGGRALARHPGASWPKFAPIIWARFDLAVARLRRRRARPEQPARQRPGLPDHARGSEGVVLEVAGQAHRRGLSVGMKNGIETSDRDTVAAFDWALNEECFQYDECDALQPFIDAGKAVFAVDYRAADGRFCRRRTGSA